MILPSSFGDGSRLDGWRRCARGTGPCGCALAHAVTADVTPAWNALDLDRQRAVVDTLLTVVLHSPGRGARRFDPTTVDLTWK